MALLSALRHRNFRLFFAGQAISQLGDAVFTIALTWATLQVAPDAAGLGAVFTTFFGAQVALLLAGGIVVDRFPRKTLVVVSDIVQGLLVAALTVLALTGTLSLAALVVFGALFGAASAIAMPALSAFVPETVPREDLTSANSLHQGTRTVTQIAGPAIGGVLVALYGVGAAFGLNAASFALSATLLALATGAPRPAPATARRSVLRDVREGAAYVMGQPWIWITIAIFSLINIAEAGARVVALPILLERVLDAGPEALGLVHSVGAVGALVAYVAIGAFAPERHRGVLAYFGVLGGGLAVVAYGLAPTLAMLALASFVRAACFAVFSLAWETSLAEQVEERMRGRVYSLDMLGSFAFLPVAMSAAAALALLVGPRMTFVGAGIVIAAGALLGLLLPSVRRFEHVEKRGAGAGAPGLGAPRAP